jgi:hypothetical protein
MADALQRHHHGDDKRNYLYLNIVLQLNAKGRFCFKRKGQNAVQVRNGTQIQQMQVTGYESKKWVTKLC